MLEVIADGLMLVVSSQNLTRVGTDDLAYDVGGSASCGARTILLDLDEDYGQTAKKRFGPNSSSVAWNTASTEEITNREAMNRAAESKVDKRISRLSMLPDAVNEILQGE